MGRIRYVIVKREVYVKGEKKTIYYPQKLSDGLQDTKSLSKKAALAGTLSAPEFAAYAKGLMTIMEGHLLDGMTVRLDGFGTFSPNISATMVQKKEDCTADTITKKTVRFTPSEELKQRLKSEVYYRKADNIDKGLNQGGIVEDGDQA